MNDEHQTINFGGQDVEAQGQTRPMFYLEAWLILLGRAAYLVFDSIVYHAIGKYFVDLAA